MKVIILEQDAAKMWEILDGLHKTSRAYWYDSTYVFTGLGGKPGLYGVMPPNKPIKADANGQLFTSSMLRYAYDAIEEFVRRTDDCVLVLFGSRLGVERSTPYRACEAYAGMDASKLGFNLLKLREELRGDRKYRLEVAVYGSQKDSDSMAREFNSQAQSDGMNVKFKPNQHFWFLLDNTSKPDWANTGDSVLEWKGKHLSKLRHMQYDEAEAKNAAHS